MSINNSSSTPEQQTSVKSLPYVHQEEWQCHLLERYENIIVLMDATYKMTKYELSLNVVYAIVADFVIQSESTKLCMS